MSRDSFRHALAARLGQVITPEVAAWLECHCFPYEIGYSVPGAQRGGEMLDRILQLEREMIQLPQVECPVREFFAPGLYAREITIKKDTVLIGAVHRTENMAVLSRGRLRLVTEAGTTEVSAEHANQVLMVRPGVKNAALALETSVWTNYFPTTETNPDRLVELLTECRRDELLGGSNNVQLLANNAEQQKLGV